MIFPINEIKKCKILIIGDIMLDRYWFSKDSKSLYEVPPTSIIHVTNKEDILGGAANIAKNIISLGASSTLIGTCGNDESGKLINNLLKPYDICSKIVFDKNNTTTLNMRVLGEVKPLLSIDFENIPNEKSINKLYKIFTKEIESHEIVIFSDYNKGSLIQIDKMILFAKKLKIPTLVYTKGNSYKKYAEANIIIFHELEIKKIVGEYCNEKDLNNKVQLLRKNLMLDVILVIKAEYGMNLFDKNGYKYIKPQSNEILSLSDVSDNLVATIAICKSAGLNWYNAIQWANISGSIALSKLANSEFANSVVYAHELL